MTEHIEYAPPPPIHLTPILEGKEAHAMLTVQERMQNYGIDEVVVLGGGGATLPQLLGCLQELSKQGIVGTRPVAAVGTSTGSIATSLWSMVGLENPKLWEKAMRPIAELQGFRKPWGELSEKAKSPFALRKLAFSRYFEHNIRPFIPQEPVIPARPAVTGIVTTQARGIQPHLYFNDHWENADGTIRSADLFHCVERSCSIPGVFIAQQRDPHLGLTIDGGVNKYSLHCPIDVAKHMLAPTGGRIIALEPVSDHTPGIYWEELADTPNVELVRISMKKHASLLDRAQNVFVFKQDAYQLGQEWGAMAAQEIDSRS